MNIDGPMNAEAQLRDLAGWLPTIDQPGFDFGHWEGGETRADGVITMPYYEFSTRARELISALPVTADFSWPDWMKTAEAQALVNDQARIADVRRRATPVDRAGGLRRSVGSLGR